MVWAFFISPKDWGSTLLRHEHDGKGSTRQDQNLLKATLPSIAIVYFLQTQRKSKNIPCFFAFLENLTSIFLWIAIKVSTSKSFQLCPFLFFSPNYEKSSSFLATTFFDFFTLPPTLAIHPFFFDVGWLNFSFLVFTISITFSKKFECGTCSPRSCRSFSLQGILVCEGRKAFLTS